MRSDIAHDIDINPPAVVIEDHARIRGQGWGLRTKPQLRPRAEKYFGRSGLTRLYRRPAYRPIAMSLTLVRTSPMGCPAASRTTAVKAPLRRSRPTKGYV